MQPPRQHCKEILQDMYGKTPQLPHSYNHACVHAFKKVDKAVSPDKIRKLRTKTSADLQISTIKRQTTTDNRKLMKTKYGLNDGKNPLFRLQLDLYRLV